MIWKNGETQISLEWGFKINGGSKRFLLNYHFLTLGFFFKKIPDQKKPRVRKWWFGTPIKFETPIQGKNLLKLMVKIQPGVASGNPGHQLSVSISHGVRSCSKSKVILTFTIWGLLKWQFHTISIHIMHLSSSSNPIHFISTGPFLRLCSLMDISLYIPLSISCCHGQSWTSLFACLVELPIAAKVGWNIQLSSQYFASCYWLTTDLMINQSFVSYTQISFSSSWPKLASAGSYT